MSTVPGDLLPGAGGVSQGVPYSYWVTDTAVHVVSAVVAPSPQRPLGQNRRTELVKAPGHSQPHILPRSDEAFVEASPVPIHRMAETPLGCSTAALEEDGAPQESSSPVEPHDVTAEQPLQPGQ